MVEELGNETLVYGEVPGEIAAVEIDRALPAPLPGSRARVAARLQGFTDVAPGEILPLACAPTPCTCSTPAGGGGADGRDRGGQRGPERAVRLSRGRARRRAARLRGVPARPASGAARRAECARG